MKILQWSVFQFNFFLKSVVRLSNKHNRRQTDMKLGWELSADWKSQLMAVKMESKLSILVTDLIGWLTVSKHNWQ